MYAKLRQRLSEIESFQFIEIYDDHTIFLINVNRLVLLQIIHSKQLKILTIQINFEFQCS